MGWYLLKLLVLLPLMLYHALQLIYASMVAQAMARRLVKANPKV